MVIAVPAAGINALKTGARVDSALPYSWPVLKGPLKRLLRKTKNLDPICHPLPGCFYGRLWGLRGFFAEDILL
ncbi:hypothetical protein JTE90_015671 [Oedothorax gibbosus]|uniref:Uncharacterized protein n=1 Tax=Oedothorax gibbosus TaxID=931172 RepID=A0AAV6TCN8_9ARAC|nr:hypothetical protein JTE90_015671 [Oedothorax gibbosus]